MHRYVIKPSGALYMVFDQHTSRVLVRYRSKLYCRGFIDGLIYNE